MPDSSTPKRAVSKIDAQGQQQEYRDGDGIGVIKSATDAKQGSRNPRMLVILGASIALAIVAYFILRAAFFTGPATGQ